ncbi:MAG: sulfotransferase family 2 domain-containing protein [Pseudomonadota bacterium]
MLISHRHKFIYLKTIKTAGTSIELALETLCLPQGHPGLLNPTPTVETDAGIVGARGHFAKKSAWRNHMTAAEVRAKVSPHIWNSYFKFCNIRNPWDKTVSWFHFKNPDIKSCPHSEIIDTFRDWLGAKQPIGQDFPIYSIENEPVVDDVIRYEKLEEDYARICQKLGVEIKAIPSEKTENRGKKIPYPRYFDLRTRNIVKNKYKREIDHFGWTFQPRSPDTVTRTGSAHPTRTSELKQPQ